MDGTIRPGACAPGDLVAERFLLLRPLGQGSMGALWVAHDKRLDIDVAVKFIHPAQDHRADVRARFAQEAMAAARIQSPHVVGVLDFGENAGGHPYIAMELLRGTGLADRLEAERKLGSADVIRVVVHACKGLTKAHAAGIVHRDIKPENLFLCDDDDGFVLKILDFGIAKAPPPAGGLLHETATGQLVGTPLYMSPEQALGLSASPSSDLYSLACVAYRCLTGSPVFEVRNVAVLLVHLATKEPPPLSSHVQNVPSELEAWFAKALHKNPDYRFADARQLAETFVQACEKFSAGDAAAAGPPDSAALLASLREGDDAPSSVHGASQGQIPARPSIQDTLPGVPMEEQPAVPHATPLSEPRVRVLGAESDSWPEETSPRGHSPLGAARQPAGSTPRERASPGRPAYVIWILAVGVVITLSVALGWILGRLMSPHG